MDEPAFAGCLVAARLIGVIEAEQTEEDGMTRNDRLIAVAAESRQHKHVRSLRTSPTNSSQRSNTSSFPTTPSKAKNSNPPDASAQTAPNESSKTASNFHRKHSRAAKKSATGSKAKKR
jgi:inorganic pyrophosphatase